MAQGEVYAKDRVLFVINGRSRTVEILRAIFTEITGCKADNTRELVADRYHYPVAKEIVYAAFFRAFQQSHLNHQLNGVAFFLGILLEAVPLTAGITYADELAELLRPSFEGIVPGSNVFRVLQCHIADIILYGHFVNGEHRILLCLLLQFLRSQGALFALDIDVVCLGKFGNSVGEREGFVSHQEPDGVTSLLARAITKPRLFARIHDKRRSFLRMERTAALIVCAFLLELYATALNNIHNVRSSKNLLYAFIINHNISVLAYKGLFCRPLYKRQNFN